MNYVALDSNMGKPLPGDLVWSALPDAPVVEPRAARGWNVLWMRAAGMIRRVRWNSPDSSWQRERVGGELTRRGVNGEQVTAR